MSFGQEVETADAAESCRLGHQQMDKVVQVNTTKISVRRKNTNNEKRDTLRLSQCGINVVDLLKRRAEIFLLFFFFFFGR